MLKNITIGQYYNKDSLIHRLDPRTKILGTFLYLISLFIYQNPISYSLCFLFLLITVILASIPFKLLLKCLKGIMFILILTVTINLFLTPGDNIIFSLWKITITDRGLITSLYMGIKLVLLITGTSIMTYTTTPSELTSGMESLLSPLKVLKIPVHEISMMMSIALRFIPVLLGETNKIIKAQSSRGANFDEGNIIEKAKALIPILIPLFIASFMRANELSEAMESRCYNGGDNRTKLHPLSYKFRDYISFIIMILYISIIVLLKVFNISII